MHKHEHGNYIAEQLRKKFNLIYLLRAYTIEGNVDLF